MALAFMPQRHCSVANERSDFTQVLSGHCVKKRRWVHVTTPTETHRRQDKYFPSASVASCRGAREAEALPEEPSPDSYCLEAVS